MVTGTPGCVVPLPGEAVTTTEAIVMVTVVGVLQVTTAPVVQIS